MMQIRQLQKKEINGIIGSELSVNSDSEVFYNKEITGNTIGTYCFNPKTEEERIVSYNKMEVHQMYDISHLL